LIVSVEQTIKEKGEVSRELAAVPKKLNKQDIGNTFQLTMQNKLNTFYTIRSSDGILMFLSQMKSFLEFINISTCQALNLKIIALRTTYILCS